jgi:hypothetical protein
MISIYFSRIKLQLISRFQRFLILLYMTSSILALSYFIFANGISSDTRLSHIYF